MGYDHGELEARWQEYWEKEKVFHFNFDSKKPIFSIDNPPRYANAALHLGHATSYTHIDFAARYKRLRGYEVYFPLCADVNGMPIEKSVEKKFNVNKHNTDRQTLIRMCKDFANSNIEEMTRQFKILGHGMDPSIFYQTNAEQYRRITQISFIRMFKRGLVYRAKQPITWCPSCGTALASAEVEYADASTKLNYILFKDEDGSPVTIATSRPELLGSCQLVAVHPDDPRYSALIGRTLRTPIFDKKVKVVGDDIVLPDFGTGVVMICSIGDKDDLEWIRRYHLPVEESIDKDGKMTALAGRFEGMPIKEARGAIIEELRANGLLQRQEPLEQSVGECWRCQSPVEFLNVEQWFLKILDFRDKVLEMGSRVQWFPPFMKQRFENWTNSLGWDWCISRQRYFATAIPLWLCTNDGCDGVVLASEDSTYIDPTVDPPPVDKCPKCSSELKGCEDVFDTWMDSSLSPLYCCYWERDAERFKDLFPMSLRPQSHDIIRTWAFYTILRTYQIMEDIPWKDMVISGFIMAPDGRPMHTSLGNVIDPLPIIDKYGADAMRYFAGTCSLGRDQPFQEKEVVHGRRLAEKVKNIGKFIGNAILNYDGTTVQERTPIDRWILSRFSRIVTEVTEAFEVYAFDRATKTLENFIWHELADHYLEIVKPRVYVDKDPSAVATLYEIGLGVITMLSVIQPHICEEVYQTHFKGLAKAKCVALAPWPTPPPLDEENEIRGELVKEIVSALRGYKAEKGSPLNAPMPEVQIVTEHDISEMLVDIRNTNNSKDVLLRSKGDLKKVPSVIKGVKSKIGPVFKAKARMVIAALERADPVNISDSLSRGDVALSLDDGEEVTLSKDQVKIEYRWTMEGKDVDLIRTKGAIVVVEVPKGGP